MSKQIPYVPEHISSAVETAKGDPKRDLVPWAWFALGWFGVTLPVWREFAASGRSMGGNELHRAVPASLGAIDTAVNVLGRRLPAAVSAEVGRLTARLCEDNEDLARERHGLPLLYNLAFESGSEAAKEVLHQLRGIDPADEEDRPWHDFGFIQATSITMNALYYMAPGMLKHVVIFIGERVQARAGDQADVANLTLSLRELLTRGKLMKCVTMKGEDGQLRTVMIEQEGPVGYVETTTQQVIFEEDSTRLIPLSTDESPEQTRAIIEMQARQAAGKAAPEAEREAIRQKYQAVHRMLKPATVRIPYAELLTLDAGYVVARRTFPQLLTVISAVALLRQRQKEVNGDGSIDADLTD